MANTIQIILDVDDKGSAKVKQFSASLTDQVKQAGAAAKQSAGAVGQVEAAFQKMQAGASSAFATLKAHWMAFTAATAAAVAVVKGAVNAFMEEEAAQMKLAVAMRNQGDFTRESYAALVDYAAQLQKTTVYSDDSTLATMANLKTYGMSTAELKKATEATMDLATAKGMDLLSASELVGKAFVGETGTLARYGIIVEEGLEKTQKFDAVLGQIQQRFGGSAQAETETYAGQWKQLANWWGDIAEKVGLAFLKTMEAVQFVVGMVGVAFYTMLEYGAKGLRLLSEQAERLPVIGKYFAGVTEHLKTIEGGFITAKEASLEFSDKNLEMLTSFNRVEEAAEKMGKGIKGALQLTEAEKKAMEADLKLREDYLKKWEGMKDTIGLQGLEKELTLLNKEYETYRRFVEDKAAVDRWYSLGRANLISGAAIKAAEDDKKSLESRLSDAQKFYQSLQGMIQKNIEDQKKGVEELNALYKQMADTQKSGEAQIRSFQEIGMTPEQKYQSQKTALYDQYMVAQRTSGQEAVKAWEEYKQALVSFGQTWSAGVTKTSQNMLFGDQTSVIAAGKDIIASVVSDLALANDAQRRALVSLAEEKQKEIEANKAWGAQLVQTAQDGAAEINKLKDVIGELEAQIAAMQKTITISGDDRVSQVVDVIARNLAALHDKTVSVYITTFKRTLYDGYSPTGESVGPALTPSDFAPAPLNLDAGWSSTPYALGTGYVPKTGMYLLHRGEAVETPKQAARQSSMRFGDIVINVPESAAPQRPEDWRSITRDYIVPELRKIGLA